MPYIQVLNLCSTIVVRYMVPIGSCNTRSLRLKSMVVQYIFPSLNSHFTSILPVAIDIFMIFGLHLALSFGRVPVDYNSFCSRCSHIYTYIQYCFLSISRYISGWLSKSERFYIVQSCLLPSTGPYRRNRIPSGQTMAWILRALNHFWSCYTTLCNP